MKNTEMTLTEYCRLLNELSRHLTSNNPLYPGSWWEKRLKMFMRQEDPWNPELWETWRHLTSGAVNAKELKRQYKQRGGSHDVVLHILNNLQASSHRTKTELLVAPVKMLGLNKPATITEVNTRLLERGFKLLTTEMSISLSLEIEFAAPFCIAMEPVSKKKDSQQFSLAMTNGILYASQASFQLPLTYDLVFRR